LIARIGGNSVAAGKSHTDELTWEEIIRLYRIAFNSAAQQAASVQRGVGGLIPPPWRLSDRESPNKITCKRL
jgi:hypothetical protein